jgi:hypothetical protein
MVTTINRTNFGGRQLVTCWTCHRCRNHPVVTPNLDTIYGMPLLESDDLIAPVLGSITAEQIIDS